MYSYHEATFSHEFEYDLIAKGIQNVWICQIGSENTDGSFNEFIDTLLQSEVTLYIQTYLVYLLMLSNIRLM